MCAMSQQIHNKLQHVPTTTIIESLSNSTKQLTQIEQHGESRQYEPSTQANVIDSEHRIATDRHRSLRKTRR